MAYKKSIVDEFKGKGFYDPNTGKFTSTDKKDAGVEYDIKEVLAKIGKDGEEIQISAKRSEVTESIDIEE